MTYPTPTGNAPQFSQYTTLPWQDQPTTDQTEAQAVAIVRQYEGSKTANAFKTWYDGARKKDPSITPNQAVAAFLTGYAISGNLQATINALDKIPGAAATGAENAYKTLVSNPLDFLRNIAAFFDKLSQASTWLRIAEFLLGAGLIIVGLAKLTAGTPVGKAAGNAAKAAALI
jgi:hypothetical protein